MNNFSAISKWTHQRSTKHIQNVVCYPSEVIQFRPHLASAILPEAYSEYVERMIDLARGMTLLLTMPFATALGFCSTARRIARALWK
jgi:hypothetical protein